MRESQRLGNSSRVVDVASCAASPFFAEHRAVVVELECDAHDIVAFVGQLRRDDRTVHPAGHRNNHASELRRLWESERIDRFDLYSCRHE